MIGWNALPLLPRLVRARNPCCVPASKTSFRRACLGADDEDAVALVAGKRGRHGGLGMLVGRGASGGAGGSRSQQPAAFGSFGTGGTSIDKGWGELK